MTTKIKVAPQNSLLVVLDKGSVGETPQSMGGKLVASTPSCIVVRTLSAADGETSVTLTDGEDEPHRVPGLQKVFSGALETPSKCVNVCTVVLDPVLTMPLHKTKSNAEIWANSDTEPSELCILIA